MSAVSAAEDVVRALADCDDPRFLDRYDDMQCSICLYGLPEFDGGHEADCPWILAREWVAARVGVVLYEPMYALPVAASIVHSQGTWVELAGKRYSLGEAEERGWIRPIEGASVDNRRLD